MKKLLLIGNHIGNPMDLSQRAIAELQNADMIVAEFSSRLVSLAKTLGIAVTDNIVSTDDLSYEHHLEIMELLKNDKSVVLISEAGLPMIADPGIETVHFLLKNNIDVDIVPGPSIPSIAHALSGVKPFNSNFLFQEFMQYPLEEIPATLKLLKPLPHTLVIIDLPGKMETTLNLCLEIFGDRNAALLMMLTTPESEVVRGNLSELSKYCSENEFPKLLNTLVISGNVTDVWEA